MGSPHQKKNCFNPFNTILIYLTLSFLVSEYTKISSMYIIANLFKYDCNVLLNIFCIVAGTSVNPNGMTKYSKIPYFVLNDVFHSFCYLIWNFVLISVSNNNGYLLYLFLIVTALIFFVINTHFNSPFFFGTNMTGWIILDFEYLM